MMHSKSAQKPFEEAVANHKDIRRRFRPALLIVGFGLLWVSLVTTTSQAQTLLSQTTWGGEGSDTAEGVATAADGTSYVVGITDSFTTDPFGTPSPRIFLIKFAPDGSLS